MTDVRRVQPGDLFCERYRIERLLKAGGMGAVFVAEHLQTRRKVALKLMHPEIVADSDARAKFAQEAQVAALIDSPNIVDVYDAGVDPATGMPFLAMELLTGKELGQLLRDAGRLDPKTVVDYVAQVSRGLDRAHAAGVVHRDLKPENLFLSLRAEEPPRVKILDFGIAKMMLAPTPQTTRASGTPLYMAPEQAKHGATLGPFTDVWALGLITYTLLVGKSYWLAADLHALYGEILSGVYEAPSAHAAKAGVTLPPAFDAWFGHCVALDPKSRFGSAGEAAARLAGAFGLAVPTTSPKDPFGLGTVRTDTGASNPTPGLAPSPTSLALASNRATPPEDDGALPWRRIALGALVGLSVSMAAYFGYRHFAKPVPATHADKKTAVSRIVVGLSDATCIVSDLGKVSCKGMAFGGNGRQDGRETADLSDVTDLAVGKHHACALLKDRSVMCWGDNQVGELGDGTTVPHAPKKVFGITDAVAVASSIHGSCARSSDGKVLCWGGNKYGQIGDGTTTDRLVPVPIEGIGDAKQIALGQDHACALLGDGTVRCWGRNADGELGNAVLENHPHPTEVVGLTDVVAIALGGHFSCARLKDGTARCWGANESGELGDGTTTSRPTPGAVPELKNIASLTAGTWHACARDGEGAIRCWGRNTAGQLGDGTTTSRLTAVEVPGTFGVGLDAGREHTCALRSDGVAMCWGRNSEGQLGDGTTHNRLEPVVFDW